MCLREQIRFMWSQMASIKLIKHYLFKRTRKSRTTTALFAFTTFFPVQFSFEVPSGENKLRHHKQVEVVGWLLTYIIYLIFLLRQRHRKRKYLFCLRFPDCNANEPRKNS